MASRPPFPPKPNLPGRLGLPGTGVANAVSPRSIQVPPRGPTIGPASKGMYKHRAALETYARANGVPSSVLDEFLSYWAENELKFAKTILGWNDAPGNAVTILKMFALFRKLGATGQQMVPAFILIAGMRSATALKMMEYVADKAPVIAPKLKTLGNAAKMLGVFICAIEVYNLYAKGEWSQIIATIYKTLMGLAVPWGAAIDALQSLMPETSPRSSALFKIVRACDPIGLGGIAVDSMVIMLQSLLDAMRGRPLDEARLSALVGRMKQGPTAIFAELGEKSGDALYDILQMDAQDWKLVGRYTMDQFGDWVRGIGR